jgi:ferritin-like metal-binding protein YciE
MARYGTLVAWAKLLGHDDAAELLEETLEQEKKTDELLNEMATDAINQRAMDAQEERESDDEDEDEDSHAGHAHRRRAA